MQVVKIYGVQDRHSTAQAKLPSVVRYTIDGRHRSKSFRTRIEADRYRGRLLHAVQDGGRFDETSGEPDAWQTPLSVLHVHEWARRWLAEQWQEWQPRTRASATEALARFVTIAVRGSATAPEELRVYLYTGLAPGSEEGWNVALERWMGKHCLMLGELDRERIADINRKLDGSQMAANTANRIRIVARSTVQSAIAAGAVTADVWQQRSKSRERRKVSRAKGSLDIRTLPKPDADGRGDRRDRHPTTRQQDIPGDDRSRLLRRPATIRDRHAPSQIRRPPEGGLGAPRCHRSRHLFR
ncbi:MAG: hypothetical protein ABI862_11220 [Ilumatobacteraceae bacterium]